MKNRIIVNLEGLTATDGYFLVGNGSAWVTESGATARASLGLGSTDSPTFAGLDLTGITNGYIPYMSASGFADGPLSTDGTDITNAGNYIIPIDGIIGISAAKASIKFVDDHVIGALTVGSLLLRNSFVGIGTDNPQSNLEISSAVAPRIRIIDTTNTCRVFMSSADTFAFMGTDSAHPFYIRTSDVNRGAVTAGGNWGLNELDAVTLLELTSTVPYITLHNSTNEDADGGRESRIIARGQQSGAEETILGYMEFAHDGAADDEKGLWRVLLNDGNDGTAPSITGIAIDSAGNIKAGTATISDNSGNLTSANGVASFTGAVTSITITNGIVTAIS